MDKTSSIEVSENAEETLTQIKISSRQEEAHNCSHRNASNVLEKSTLKFNKYVGI